MAEQPDDNMEDAGFSDDEELQAALMASLVEPQPGAPLAPQQQQAPAAAAQPGAAGAQLSGSQLLAALQGLQQAAAPPLQQQQQQQAPQPAAAAAGVSGQALLQALQMAMLGAAAPGQAAAGGQQAAAPAAAHPEAAAAAPARHAGDRYAATPPPSGPAPAWTKQADSWVAPAPAGSQPDSALLPSAAAAEQGSAVQQACSRVAGQAVSLGSCAAAAVHLPLAPAEPAGSLKLTAAAVDAAILRIPAGSSLVLALQAAWLRAAEVLAGPEGQAAPEVASCMRLWQARLAKKASSVLASDEDDDLFFAGGKHRSAFLQALESASVSPAFLDAMVSSAGASSAAEVALWEGILRDSFGALKGFSFLDADKAEGIMKRLDVVTQCPGMRRCLAAVLAREAVAAAGMRGREFEIRSILAPLLAVSTLPTYGNSVAALTFPAKDCFMQLRNYPRNRGAQVESEYSSIRRSLQRAYTAAHEICKRVATMKAGDSPLRGREVVPAWLAAAAGSSVGRAEAGSYIERVLSHHQATFYSATDGFMVGGLAVCLCFCRPFLEKADKKQGALQHLDPAYYQRQAHRLASGGRERSLAGTMLPTAGPASAASYPFVSPDRPDSEASHFVAEMFFMTQRWVHIGLLPAVYRYQALAKMLKRSSNSGEEEEDELPLEDQASTLDQWLLYDAMRAQLLDPEFANDTVQFMELQARWLVGLLQRGPEVAKQAFSIIPESIVRDMTAWLSFLIYNQSTELLGGMDISVLVSCLTGLLKHTDIVTSPPVHSSIVQLLLAMLSPQLDYRGMASGGGLGPRRVSPAESALVTVVLGTGAAQTDLLPALMAAYAHADHVVGLDVDKDQYDKFHLRGCIDALLMELWRDPSCAASLTAAAQAGGPEGGLFADFVGAVLNDLMYLLKDSLQRLEDIHALEVSKADKARWELVPQREREEKQAFYESQQSTTRGFMRMAVSTLTMLNRLVENAAVRAGFMQQAVAARAAAAAVHFVEILVGPKCTELQVDNPGQYHFDREQLLVSMVYFTVRLAEQPAFVQAVSAVPDYDESIIHKTVEALAAKQLGEYEHRRRLLALAAAVRQLRGESGGEAMDLGAAGGGGGGGGGPGGAAPDLSFQQAEPADLEGAYVAALEELAVGDFDSTADRAYNRSFAAKAERQEGDTAGKMKTLSKEVRGLTGRTRLPIYAASSICVRYDPNRMDKMRALITGPEDTPYYGGCFIFDVYFPDDYPNVPPLMELETTGGGVARFNPNLYADGKVCLSLLGTWHGGDESEKWRPGQSSLFQVLLSLQGMIFITDPYFNEPAYEGMRGTAEGATSSLKYNSEIWLNNIRYAMIEQLRRPRPGFEAPVRAHFRLLRWRIMRQCAAWMEQALDPLFQKRLRDAVLELHGLLAAL